MLLKIQDPQQRDRHAHRSSADGWSRKRLEHHIATDLHRRVGAAPNNFPTHLEAPDADQAREILRDP